MHNGAIRAVESVLQESLEVDIIVVDDNSDPTLSLPEEISSLSNVTLIKHNENSGAGAARNTGVSAAQTKWISFLDSDDYLMKDTLESRFRLAKEHWQNSETGPVIYGSGWIEPKGSKDEYIQRTPIGSSRREDFASGCWYCPGSCIIGLRDTFLKHPFDEKLSRLEDFDFGIRFGTSGGKLIIFDIASTHIDRGKTARANEIISCSKLIKSKYRSLKTTSPKTWNALSSYLDLEIASVFFKDKKFVCFSYYFLSSLFYYPRLKLHFSPGWKISDFSQREGDR